MISFLLFALAVVCDSIMDTLTHHFNNSVFANLNPFWWNPFYSHTNKYKNGKKEFGRKKISNKWLLRRINVPIQFTDAWHLFKGIKILFLIGSIITFNDFGITWFWWDIILFGMYGITWYIAFELFYSKLLIKWTK